jgi:hypothetical protein
LIALLHQGHTVAHNSGNGQIQLYFNCQRFSCAGFTCRSPKETTQQPGGILMSNVDEHLTFDDTDRVMRQAPYPVLIARSLKPVGNK